MNMEKAFLLSLVLYVVSSILALCFHRKSYANVFFVIYLISLGVTILLGLLLGPDNAEVQSLILTIVISVTVSTILTVILE